MFEVRYADEVEADHMHDGGRYDTYSQAWAAAEPLCQEHTCVVIYQCVGEDSRGNFKWSVRAVWEYGERIQ